MSQQMDASVTVVWANGEVSRGHARFLGDGNVAIADGTMEDQFFPVIRGSFRLSSKWTTTIARINGEWKIVGLHLSANVFNNSLLDEAVKTLKYVGGGGLALGLLLGWAISWFLRR